MGQYVNADPERTVNKRSTIVEVGRRTRMRNYEVQRLFETLARGEKIEIENFLILELHSITRHGRLGMLMTGDREIKIPARRREVRVRLSKHLKSLIRGRHP
jgi:nucleoid DNA-binding protein